MLEDRIVFENSQIGKGLKPLAQQGSVVIEDGVVSLFGTKGDLIDSAPLEKTTAKRAWITGGQTVNLILDGRKYNATPGNGSAVGTIGFSTKSGALTKAING